jgi:hypothetical protein
MATKITVVFTRPVSVLGLADLYAVRDRLTLQGLDPEKAGEYAWSALNEALMNGPASGSPSTLSKITVSIEPADAAADVVFPEIA